MWSVYLHVLLCYKVQYCELTCSSLSYREAGIKKRPSSKCISLFSSKLFKIGRTFLSAFSIPSNTRILPSTAALTAHCHTKETTAYTEVFSLIRKISVPYSLPLHCTTTITEHTLTHLYINCTNTRCSVINTVTVLIHNTLTRCTPASYPVSTPCEQAGKF
jgi:hypothetical protein